MKLRLTALVLASLAFPLSLMTACGDSEPVEDEGVGGAGGEPGCPDYLTECSASCVNTDIDPAHCGECGTECGDGTACVDGACVPSSCRDGQVACGDECVTLARDPAHCGDCDTACESGEACNQGVCVTDCGEGLLACEGSCVNPQSDPVYCGATACGDAAGPEEVGTPCSPTQACVAGVCQELEPQWSTAGRIDTSDYGVDTGENGIAADGQGNAWAVWRQGTDTPTPAPDGTQRVFARYYDAASRTWLEPVVRLDEETARPRNLRIAMNAAGDVAVVWASADQLVKLAYKAVGEAAWQPPVTVSTSTPLLGIPDVTVAGDGTAWIAWAQVTGPTDTPADTRVVFTRSYDGTALGSLQQMPSLGLGHSYNADIEANQAGDLALIWEEDVSATTGDVVGVGFVGAPRITRRPASTGIWDAPFDGRVNQVASRVAYRADIAIAGGGLILATWTEYDTGLQLYRAQTKVFDGTAWEITTAVDGSSQSEDYPTVSLN
ncbi:MAG TPA: hypothetical protein VLC09_12745, partial [Polyangiaceae bacterium]|nr:hypothetical protein [Polyangiaceae bacterium]